MSKPIATTSVATTDIDWDIVEEETGAWTVTRTTVERVNPGMSKAGAEWLLRSILDGRVTLR